MKIQDETNVQAVLANLSAEQRAVIEAALSKARQPSERTKGFRVRNAPDGTSYLQVYGCGARLDRSEATWLFEHASEGLTFLREHPEVK